MAALNDRQRAFIVRRLARFDTPSEVAEAVSEEFSIGVDRSQVAYYDPTGAKGKDQLAQKWVDIFWETRDRFREETESIAVANKAYRLKVLNDMARRARQQGNYPLVADLLEQAAKETGGKYTDVQKLEHSGPDGGPVPYELTWYNPEPGDAED